MHVDDGARPRPLVQIVNVLRGDHHLARPNRFKPRQCLVRGIGGDRGVPQLPPARVVKGQHPRRVAREGLGCRHLFEAHRCPDPVGIAKCREPGFPRNAGAGQDHNAGGLGPEIAHASHGLLKADIRAQFWRSAYSGTL
jgi:hypothetical protein